MSARWSMRSRWTAPPAPCSWACPARRPSGSWSSRPCARCRSPPASPMPSGSRRMLAGFTSRWMTPCLCAKSRPRQTSITMVRSFSGSGRRSAGIMASARSMPVEQLHGDEDRPVRLAQLEDGDDVGVLQPRGGPRLALEAHAGVLVGQELGADGLERHQAVEDGVARLVDGAHGAAAEDALYLVLPDPRRDAPPARRRARRAPYDKGTVSGRAGRGGRPCVPPHPACG